MLKTRLKDYLRNKFSFLGDIDQKDLLHNGIDQEMENQITEKDQHHRQRQKLHAYSYSYYAYRCIGLWVLILIYLFA